MAYLTGAGGTLYHINYKINTDQRGFNMKFHAKGTAYADVMTGAAAIAAQLKGIMPTDAEIFYATVTRDDTTRDSQLVRAALGAGVFAQVVSSPPAELFDNSRSALLVRLENTEGGWVTRKINPLPDPVMTDGSLIAAIADVVGTPLAAPVAPANTDTYAAAFGKFLTAVMFYTIMVKSNHPPGADYTYAPWLNGYVLRQGIKKGGRVFAS